MFVMIFPLRPRLQPRNPPGLRMFGLPGLKADSLGRRLDLCEVQAPSGAAQRGVSEAAPGLRATDLGDELGASWGVAAGEAGAELWKPVDQQVTQKKGKGRRLLLFLYFFCFSSVIYIYIAIALYSRRGNQKKGRCCSTMLGSVRLPEGILFNLKTHSEVLEPSQL